MKDEEHFVEVIEISTGKTETRMGPMPANKAERVLRGLLMRINDEFFVDTGTDAELTARKKARSE